MHLFPCVKPTQGQKQSDELVDWYLLFIYLCIYFAWVPTSHLPFLPYATTASKMPFPPPSAKCQCACTCPPLLQRPCSVEAFWHLCVQYHSSWLELSECVWARAPPPPPLTCVNLLLSSKQYSHQPGQPCKDAGRYIRILYCQWRQRSQEVKLFSSVVIQYKPSESSPFYRQSSHCLLCYCFILTYLSNRRS